MGFKPAAARFLGVLNQVDGLLTTAHKYIIYRIPYEYVKEGEDEPGRDVPVVPDFFLPVMFKQLEADDRNNRDAAHQVSG